MHLLDKFKIDRKLLRQLDYGLIITCVLIVLFGAMNIYSATYTKFGFKQVLLQLIWICLGLVVVYLILTFDYIFIANYSKLIYWASILLLVINDVFGSTHKGAKSWLNIGSRGIQPSEFAKLAMVIMLAKKINDMEGDINKPKNFFTLAFYAALPMVLILIQPDMGMTEVCFFIVLGIFFMAGLDLKVMLGGLTALVLCITIAWNAGIIKPYQKSRITSFLHPEEYALTTGLQVIQSEIGVGSGGILGKGFTHGTQISGGFIPEAHNDFIFSVVGEEWGLIGSSVLLILYCILLYKCIKIAKSSKDLFGSILSMGIASTLLFSIFQNIGMTIGMVPITGITLPFMSYGGSSILTSFIAIALVLNVGMRKEKINF